MKKILIITCLFLISCNDNPVINLHPPVNPFNGYYIMHTLESTPGSATIYVSQNGSIQNGIKIHLSQEPVLIWMDGMVNNAGQFTGCLWNDSGSGKITGIFTGFGGSGSYQIAFNDNEFNGFWYALPE